MWTRAGIKKDAKRFLRNNYWKAFVVCLILTLITPVNYSGRSKNRQNSSRNINQIPFSKNIDKNIEWINDHNILDEKQYDFPYSTVLGGIKRNVIKYPTSIPRSVPIFIFLIITIGLVIIRQLLEVGAARFFIKGYKEDARVSYLFSTFNSKEWLAIFKTQLLRRIYIFLWSLLLMVPGIIKSYEYRMVPYILAENPNISTKEALKLSKDMTYGHKFDIFILDLSFIGWYILGLLLVGIGILFVIPYEQATQASLYNVLSNYKLENLEHTTIDII